jgi:hypothetical protein
MHVVGTRSLDAALFDVSSVLAMERASQQLPSQPCLCSLFGLSLRAFPSFGYLYATWIKIADWPIGAKYLKQLVSALGLEPRTL